MTPLWLRLQALQEEERKLLHRQRQFRFLGLLGLITIVGVLLCR